MHDNLTVSLATGCKNRVASLRWALPSWLALEEVDEIVIVDWSSDKPVHEEMADFDDPRIKFVRVEDQPFWCAARCHNVEVLATTSMALLRTDSDVRIAPDFFQHHPVSDNGVFWNLPWQTATCDEDRHLAGTIYTRRENFLLVKGYNEHLQSCGFEDDDLFLRMVAAGLRKEHARRDDLQHLPHDNVSRMSQISPAFAGGQDRMMGLGLNIRLSQEHPWSAPNEHMSEWNVSRKSENLLVYIQKV